MACCPGGYALAGWLMGYPTSSSSAEGLTWTAPRQNRWGAYFQDEWKATRKLTINMGLRWDFFQVPHDVNREVALAAAGYPDHGFRRPAVSDHGSDARRELRFLRAPTIAISCRAWVSRTALTDKWVIRAGAGWFVNVQQMNNMTILDLQPPFSGTFGWNQVDQAAQSFTYTYGGQIYTATDPHVHVRVRRF